MPRPKPPACAKVPRKCAANSPHRNAAIKAKPSSAAQKLYHQGKKDKLDSHIERDLDDDEKSNDSSDAADDVYDRRRNDENAGRQYGTTVHEENYESSERRTEIKKMKQSRHGPECDRNTTLKKQGGNVTRENDGLFEDREYHDDEFVDIDAIETKVYSRVTEILEKKLVSFEEKIMMVVHDAVGSSKQASFQNRMVKGKSVSDFSISATQRSLIGSWVRHKMFRIIKFMDDKTLASQGKSVVEKCKYSAGIVEPTTRAVEQFILQTIREFHNRHKGHVKKKIRDLATGE